jgi:hypothetical protein
MSPSITTPSSIFPGAQGEFYLIAASNLKSDFFLFIGACKHHIDFGFRHAAGSSTYAHHFFCTSLCPIWVGCANTIEEVKTQARHRVAEAPREWVILDQTTGHKSVLTPEQIARQ